MKKPSLFKRISSLGIAKRPPQLSAAEQLVQLSIRKRATAFVDARDDLETKIGRLSRRLNFLMTESDLWRDKFITFEQYAEKLSLEANELRSKINKEQRETKRLSGLVTMTTVEKTKLQNRKTTCCGITRGLTRDWYFRAQRNRIRSHRSSRRTPEDARNHGIYGTRARGNGRRSRGPDRKSTCVYGRRH